MRNVSPGLLLLGTLSCFYLSSDVPSHGASPHSHFEIRLSLQMDSRQDDSRSRVLKPAHVNPNLKSSYTDLLIMTKLVLLSEISIASFWN